MRTMSEQELRELREVYTPGSLVRLDADIEDPYHAPKAGTYGTVRCVDDIGQIHVSWHGGGSLALVPGVDKWTLVSSAPRT